MGGHVRLASAFAILFLICSQTTFAAEYNLSESCGSMSGDHVVEFNGQAFPFSLRRYELRLNFPKSLKGVTFYTNFGVINVTETVDLESLTNTFQQYMIIPDVTVYDCNAQPQKCLDSVNNDLKIFTVAQQNIVSDASAVQKSALECGLERIRLFNRKVRSEVLQQRQIN